MAIDSDVRVEERERPLRRARPPIAPAPRPSLPAPLAEPQEAAPSTHRLTSRWGDWTPFIVIGAVLAVASIYVTYGQAQWLSVIGGVLALGALAQALLSERRRQGVISQPIALITLGVTLVASSELMHALGAGFGSYADALALLSYVPLVAGLIRLTQARFRESALDTLLVAAIVPASLGVFAWLPLVEAIHRWVPGGSPHTWTAAVFLAVDVLAVAIVARLSVFFRGKPAAYQFLLGALTCMLGAHISRTVATLTDMVPAPLGSHTLMLLGFGLVAAAALHPSMSRATSVGRARPVLVGRGHLALLSMAILFGPAIVIWRYVERGSWVVVAAAGPALVSMLVVVHLSRMIRERQRLEFATNHDALTGLVNRACFHDRVMLALARGDGGAAVLFLDLDRFKNVNDTLGHDAGDQLLRLVAERLSGCARRMDTVARISGDEFAVLLPDAQSAAHATRLAERMLAQFKRPFHVAGRSLFMTPSIGIALHPDHGTDVDTLLRHADAAMYQAKAAGRKTIRMYDGALRASAQRQLAVESRMHQAIADGEMRLHYQPRLDVKTGEVLGVEALVRWEHPTHGLIPPEAFIRMVEETGLVAPLGAWVLRNACAQMAAWHAAGHEGLEVSVNVSALQFKLQDVPALVRNVLAETGLAPTALELELTERAGLDPDGTVGAALVALQGLGVRCSIDDFGTGYSSISYLHEFPVDAIKLDRSFVRAISEGVDAPIIRAMIALAHNLGIRVVAEGVETKAQMKFLKKYRCDEVQGFLYSEALPARDLETFLDRRAAMSPTSRRRLPTGGLVMLASPVIDEETLARLLGEESELRRLDSGPRVPAAEEEDEDGKRRRGAVLFFVTGIMVAPVLMGLGAGGGLPPGVQDQVGEVFRAVGAQPPQRAPAALVADRSTRARTQDDDRTKKRRQRDVAGGRGTTPSSAGTGTATSEGRPAAPSLTSSPARAAATRSSPAQRSPRRSTATRPRTAAVRAPVPAPAVQPAPAPSRTAGPAPGPGSTSTTRPGPATPAPAPVVAPAPVLPPAPILTPAPVLAPTPVIKPNSTHAPGQIKKSASVTPAAPFAQPDPLSALATPDPAAPGNGNGNGNGNKP